MAIAESAQACGPPAAPPSRRWSTRARSPAATRRPQAVGRDAYADKAEPVRDLWPTQPPTAAGAGPRARRPCCGRSTARFIRPAPGGDLLRTPAILPTGRNLHGFDPFRIPSAFAVQDGARQAAAPPRRHIADGNGLPETVAIVLWGTDNLKNEGGPIAQALALSARSPASTAMAG